MHRFVFFFCPRGNDQYKSFCLSFFFFFLGCTYFDLFAFGFCDSLVLSSFVDFFYSLGVAEEDIPITAIIEFGI